MAHQWHLLHSTILYTNAAIIKGLLEQNSIPVQLLNKQDSMYNVAIGHFELYVPLHFKPMAESILAGSLAN
ncbi:MAG: hypothetical protein EAY75_17325 [Bacteroidetes bacterium]|nr:MAG: hypothetical protein EAY75_17325 [Bacteroidota bacterium]